MFLSRIYDPLVGTTDYCLNRQLAVLEEQRYDRLLGKPAFRKVSERLSRYAHQFPNAKPRCLPFVLVFPKNIVPIEQQMARLVLGGGLGTRRGRAGIASRAFRNAPGLRTPVTPYLVSDVDLGIGPEMFKILIPDKRAAQLQKRGRSPLTIEEGIAVARLFPECLQDDWTLCCLGSQAHFDRQIQGIFRAGGCCEEHPLLRPEVGFVPTHMPDPENLVPSCGSRERL